MHNTFNRIIKISIYALVFLIPLFFLPFSFEAFEFNKLFLLLFFVSLALFAWLARMVVCEKEIKFKRTPLDIFVLGFLLVAILSAVFSVDGSSSLYGYYGRFSNGLLGLLCFGALYFLITNNTQIGEEKKGLSVNTMMRLFFWSGFVVVLFSYLSVFRVWPKIANLIPLPRVMSQIIFNPAAASLEGLSIFLAVMVVFLTGLILVKDEKRKIRGIFRWMMLVGSIFLLVIIDFTGAWLVVLATLILFVVFSLWKRIFRENVNRLLIPIFLIVIAGLCIPFQPQRIIFGDQSLTANLPREQILSPSTSWSIGLEAATDNIKSGFLGSGIGTYHYDFAKEKPVEMNQTWLWQIRFDRAGSHLAEILGTMGFLGILSYLAMIGLFLLIAFFLFKQASQALPLLMVFVGLLAAQFLYYQNFTLGFFFWLVLGILVVSWQKPIREKTISFKDFPELSLVFSTLVIVLGIGLLSMYFFGLKFYLADVDYAKAQRMTAGVERTQTLENAVRQNPKLAQYRTVLARAYLNEALVEMAKPADEQDVAKIQIRVATAIDQAKIATILGPNQVANWETLGMVYREIRTVAAGATEWGVKSFETAMELEPQNPVLYTELGKLYLVTGDVEKAQEQFNRAIEKKSDYIDALIQGALILERRGDMVGAINKLEGLASSFPSSTEILFQLGRLYFNNNQIDEAITQFKRVIIIFPNHSNAHYSLGVAYVSTGQNDLAIEEFEKVLELNPDNADVQAKLKQLRE